MISTSCSPPLIAFALILTFLAHTTVCKSEDYSDYAFIGGEGYAKSYLEQQTFQRQAAASSKVVSKLPREKFFDIFSTFETYKQNNDVWSDASNGRRTLSKMKYLICPIWLAGESQVPASKASMDSIMQRNKEFYDRMSWNQHDVSWDYVPDVQLALPQDNTTTRGKVATACNDYIAALGRTYPLSHTGLIVAYNAIASGDLSFRGGVAIINGNTTWMSLNFSYSVTRHEVGHNYGHPHHFTYNYDWRRLRSFDTGVLDAYDMMGSGNSGSRDGHSLVASKYFFNWVGDDAIITMQPEGPTPTCRTCISSISKVVLKPFDRADIIPSPSNLMAVHIPILGVGSNNVYSYWLSYRSNFTESMNGLSLHIVRFDLGRMYGATFDSFHMDAFGNTASTADAFILKNTCYVAQPVGALLDIDPSSIEQIQPVICVDDIVVRESITISVSFLDKQTADNARIPFKKDDTHTCTKSGANFGQKTLDMSLSKVQLIEYNGSGNDGNITFSLCKESGSGTITAYFYDSYPYAYISFQSPPSYGSFRSINASASCTTPTSTVYRGDYGQTFVLVIAEGVTTSDAVVRYTSSCIVSRCHTGQYLSDTGSCTDCPLGSVSIAGSSSISDCVSCVNDGLEPLGVKSKDCKLSRTATPSLNTGRYWRVLVHKDHLYNGWFVDIDELEFYASDDCSSQSRISTAGGIAFSSGVIGNGWEAMNAFNTWWRWGGKADSRDLFYLGIDLNRTVSVMCIKYIQPSLMVSEIQIQTKSSFSSDWSNVWISRNLPNLTNIISFVVSPTMAPTYKPTKAPLKPVSPPTNAPSKSPAIPSPPVFGPTNAPVTTSGGGTCLRPENSCGGGFFRFFRRGQTVHRTILGRCSERCSTLSLFRGLFGWKCGPCPA